MIIIAVPARSLSLRSGGDKLLCKPYPVQRLENTWPAIKLFDWLILTIDSLLVIRRVKIDILLHIYRLYLLSPKRIFKDNKINLNEYNNIRIDHWRIEITPLVSCDSYIIKACSTTCRIHNGLYFPHSWLQYAHIFHSNLKIAEQLTGTNPEKKVQVFFEVLNKIHIWTRSNNSINDSLGFASGNYAQ